MKTNIFSIPAIGVMMLAAACTPADHEMPAPDINSGDLVEGIAFSVTPDADNSNIIHLKSLMPSSYAVQWQHPQGYSQELELDLKIAFDGSYEVTFGVETRGGLVYGEPYTFTISDFCADFVTGEMWEMLTGGAGNSKTWVPDNGNYGMKQGYYSCFDPSATYLDMVRDEGKYNWYAQNLTWWEPSNSDVGITDDDLMGEMTFDLMGKAGLTVTSYTGGVPTTVSGIFDMNTDGHTMSATNVEFLHAAWTNGKAVDFMKGYQILVLTENQLMIANYRDEALSGEGRCLYCFNFVSKDYADSYVAPETVDAAPELADGWMEALATQNKYCSWKLDADQPVQWRDLYGQASTDISAAIDEDNVEALRLKMGDPGLNDYVVTLPDGSSVTGSFSIGSDGFISFANGLGSTELASGYSFATDRNSSLRVLATGEDDYGRLETLWLGQLQYDINGNPVQYLGYHFVADYGVEEAVKYKMYMGTNNTSSWIEIDSDPVYVTTDGSYTLTVNGSQTDGDPCVWIDLTKILKDNPNANLTITSIKVDGQDVAFDDSAISFSYQDDDASTYTARRYVCNPWGLASCFSSLDLFRFTTSIQITVYVSFDTGTPFTDRF